ncbi:MAG: hypothetical protein AB7G11_16360 [Phycisphaerales bacterium]
MKVRTALAAAAAACIAGPALAQVTTIDSLNVAPYWFADFFGRSDLTITNNGLPSIRFEDRNFSGSGFANRHHAALSVGGTPYLFQPTESFRFDVDVIINGAGGTEAGIWHGTAPFYPNSGNADVGQFVLLPDNNGEIAAFGGRLPFFSNNQGENAGMARAARDQTIHLTFIYDADTPVRNYRYGVNGVFAPPKFEGIDTAGFLPDSLMGVYVQGPNGRLGDVDVTFSNLSIIPSPASAALLGLGGLLAGRRRR